MTRLTGYMNDEGKSVCVGCWAASPAPGWAAYRAEVYGDYLVLWMGLRQLGDAEMGTGV